jgi:hypothetical protein
MYWLGQLKLWLEHKLENENEREFKRTRAYYREHKADKLLEAKNV